MWLQEDINGDLINDAGVDCLDVMADVHDNPNATPELKQKAYMSNTIEGGWDEDDWRECCPWLVPS